MYNRKAKNIPDHTWTNLMKEPSTSEILETIKKIPNDKAAGYDGVEINLIKLLVAKEDSALRTTLLHLFKVAFTEGATLPSWKIGDPVIPKRREDEVPS